MAHKVYTKKGDDGTTSLLSGKRIHKNSFIIRSVGSLDELNSFVGLLRSEMHGWAPALEKIQWDLFNAGSMLINDNETKLVEVTEEDIKILESSMDTMNEELPDLKNFILPYGSKAVTISHICRTICRRTENEVLSIEKILNNFDIISIYINRLSDFFFVLARYIGYKENTQEVIWKN